MPKKLEGQGKIKATDIIRDFQYARTQRKAWITAATEDLEYINGIQWKDPDVVAMEEAGVKPLTINKLGAILNLLTGLQRQNKSDFQAFPIGDEDELKSEIATRLLKNAMDGVEGSYKISEQFEDMAGVGEGWLEPYLDYSGDMAVAKLGLKKGNPFSIYPDPASKEYDLSDAEYLIKFSPDLTKNQLYKLFPRKRTEIDQIQDGRLNLDGVKDDATTGAATETASGDYTRGSTSQAGASPLFSQQLYDLTEYHYRHYIPKYYVADKNTGEIKEAKDKSEADDFVARAEQAQKDEMIRQKLEAFAADAGVLNQIASKFGVGAIEKQKAIIEQEVNGTEIEPSVVIIERMEAEIRVTAMVGTGTILTDGVCWSFPKHKDFPFNRMVAYVTTIPMAKREMMCQGFVRQLKLPQYILNKSKTQELRHLNETANSGWLTEEDSFVDPKRVDKFGSAPGINVEWKTGKTKPERLFPQPLSMAHSRLSLEAAQDIKEISGFNTDLLAMTEGGQASGRAIALRQKQGLVLVQRLFDNLSRSQKLLGRFLLSIIGEIYTLETALKVVGQAFIELNFTEPVMEQDPSGQMVPQIDPNTEGMVMEVNAQKVNAIFTEILNDTGVGKFDVTIGEGVFTETTKLANYSVMTDLMERGVPIPPDVLIAESTLSASSKEKIGKAIEQAQMAQAVPKK